MIDNEIKPTFLFVREEKKLGKMKQQPSGYGEFQDIQEEVLKNVIIKSYDDASELMAQYILKNEKIYTMINDKVEEVWYFDSETGLTVPNGVMHISNIVDKFLLKSNSVTLTNRVLHKVKVRSQIAVSEFYALECKDSSQILVKNGIYDRKEKKLLPFDARKVFFSNIPHEYKENQDCPTIKRFIKDITQDASDAETALDLLAYPADTKAQRSKSAMINGQKRGAKSTYLNLIRAFYGAENCAHISLQQLNEDLYAVSELSAKRVNIYADLNSTALNEVGTFKLITGGDPISAARKFMTRLNTMLYCKHFFSCNELPRAPVDDDAFWDRWVYLNFPYMFVEESEFDMNNPIMKIADKNILAKLTKTEEMSGLLNLVIARLDKLDREGFTKNKSGEQIKEIWSRKADSLYSFIEDCVLLEYNSVTPKADFKRAYVEYCTARKVKVSSDTNIHTTLTKLGVSSVKRGYPEQVWLWDGLKLKQEKSVNVSSIQPIQSILPFPNRIEPIKNYSDSEQGGLLGLPGYKCIKCSSSNIIAYSDIYLCENCKHKWNRGAK